MKELILVESHAETHTCGNPCRNRNTHIPLKTTNVRKPILYVLFVGAGSSPVNVHVSIPTGNSHSPPELEHIGKLRHLSTTRSGFNVIRSVLNCVRYSNASAFISPRMLLFGSVISMMLKSASHTKRFPSSSGYVPQKQGVSLCSLHLFQDFPPSSLYNVVHAATSVTNNKLVSHPTLAVQDMGKQRTTARS